MDAREIEERLPGALREAWDAERVAVANARRMTGGAVRETWALDATVERQGAPAETLPLVLRSFPTNTIQLISAPAEFAIQSAAFESGVPAPRPRFVAEDVLSLPFYLMDRVDGETIGRRLIKDAAYAEARDAIGPQLARALAAVHRTPVTETLRAVLRPAPPDGVSPAQAALDQLETLYRGVTPDPHPAFELAFRWLRRRLPAGGETVFCHGDYRIGNVIFGPEGLRAVIDWEGAHLGDPMEDIGWLCVRSWRFGGEPPVGGVCERETFFAAYEAAGRPVDADRVRWWEIYGNLRWGVITIQLAEPFLSGRNRDLEPASIGRRTAETEWELMQLMRA